MLNSLFSFICLLLPCLCDGKQGNTQRGGNCKQTTKPKLTPAASRDETLKDSRARLTPGMRSVGSCFEKT